MREHYGSYVPLSRAIRVTAFVDWNSQIHDSAPEGSEARVVAERTLEHVSRKVGRALRSIDRTGRFDVSFRVYHGWHKGFEPTANRRALMTAIAGADFLAISTQPNVAIRPEVSYGDRLISALDARLHVRLGIHLPATLREGRRFDELEEKMVDTAIAADVVDLAHREPNTWIVVLADDDDLVPPIFAAEAIRHPSQGRTILLRKRPQGSFLKLDGLLVQQ